MFKTQARYGVRPSVRPSVCPVDRQQQRRAAERVEDRDFRVSADRVQRCLGDSRLPSILSFAPVAMMNCSWSAAAAAGADASRRASTDRQ